ncbi:hypothetical protein D3C76_1054250 [compost metagenome]
MGVVRTLSLGELENAGHPQIRAGPRFARFPGRSLELQLPLVQLGGRLLQLPVLIHQIVIIGVAGQLLHQIVQSIRVIQPEGSSVIQHDGAGGIRRSSLGKSMAKPAQGLQLGADHLHIGHPVVIGDHLDMAQLHKRRRRGNMGELADQIQLLPGQFALLQHLGAEA